MSKESAGAKNARLCAERMEAVFGGGRVWEIQTRKLTRKLVIDAFPDGYFHSFSSSQPIYSGWLLRLASGPPVEIDIPDPGGPYTVLVSQKVLKKAHDLYPESLSNYGRHYSVGGRPRKEDQ